MNFRHSYHYAPYLLGQKVQMGFFQLPSMSFSSVYLGNNHRVGPWSIYVHSQLNLIYNPMCHLTTISP